MGKTVGARRFHVKHEELETALTEYLSKMGIHRRPAEIALLIRHIELVIDANRRVNLTRVTDRMSAVRLHAADSLAVLEDLENAPVGPLLDLGSGAGFPGIPLAICSDRSVVLVDSVAKKVRELELIVAAMGLENRIQAIAARAEALGRSHAGEFSVVTARAVSELPALVELAGPLLAIGGRLVCLKGSPSSEEISRANAVANVVGMRLEYQRSFDLPQAVGHRTIACYSRVGVAKIALPRREGLAQHSPLF
jgi:16S rRNA (guanine527-N7)-methyltransferase